MAVYIFDLDGTLADCQHRMHHINNGKKDWRAFFAACDEDQPIAHMVDLFVELKEAGNDMIVCTGRSDECIELTQDWLDRNNLDYDLLMMRKAGDHRPDNVIKQEMLEGIIKRGFIPTMAFDDRDQVVKMWRDNGVPCAQVAPGDF